MHLIRNFALGFIFLLVVSITQPLTAHAANLSIRLENLNFLGCNQFNGLFSVGFNIVALDGSTVVNEAAPVDFRVVTSTAYGAATFDVSVTSGDNLVFATYFPSPEPITSGTVQVFYDGSPSAASPLYSVNCQSGSISLASVSDSRLNFAAGDLVNVLYNATFEGQSSVAVYEVRDGSRGVLIGYFTADDFAPYVDNAPASNTEIKTVGKSTLYALSSGEFQINVGPDENGKYGYIIFSGLPAASVKRGVVE